MAQSFSFEQVYKAAMVVTNENYDRVDYADLEFLVRATEDTDEQGVIEAARATGGIPVKYLGCRLMRVQVVERMTARSWKIVGSYEYTGGVGLSSDDEVPPEREVLSFSAEKVHIERSLQTLMRYGNAPDMGGLIGVNTTDGSVAGADVYQPTGTLRITKWFKPSEFTDTIRRKIIYRQCRVNSGTFRGWLEGELLFLGADIEKHGTGKKDLIPVTYNFVVAQNVEDAVIGGSISNVDYEGHNVVWVRAIDKIVNGVDAEGAFRKYLAKGIDGVYVEKVYKKADFSEMGLEP